MNTLLIVGLFVFGLGALLWIVSTAMISHYDQKLFELDKKLTANNIENNNLFYLTRLEATG